MKKYVWFLIAAAFAVAIFAMVGCRPAETPATSPSPAVTPATDTKCPEVKSFVVENVYTDAYDRNVEKKDGSFTITITFDEEVAGDWSCLLNESNWTVKVTNPTRYDAAFKQGVSATVKNVTKLAKNKLEILASIVEKRTVSNTTYEAYGLLCDSSDAEQYAKSLNLPEYDQPSVADTVSVALKSTCKRYDSLGNTCCGLEYQGCCEVTCEPVTIPTGCELK